jgi:hypothetical protein
MSIKSAVGNYNLTLNKSQSKASCFAIHINTQWYLPKIHQGWSERPSQSQKDNMN